MANQSEKRCFRVIIVGAAVAGLSLAHCLNSADISYVVLEGRQEVSPPAGAGQQIAANACRILDQLNILDAVENVSTAWTFTRVFKASGKTMVSDDAVRLIEKRLGYKPALLERQELLQVFYDTQHDKSAIYFGKDVTDVVHSDLGVVVRCSDGTAYEGDIVIGADGIRSKTRQMMRDYMLGEGLSEQLRLDTHSISAESTGVFGVARLPSHLDTFVRRGDFCRTMVYGHSGFLLPLSKGRIAWVLCIKLPVRVPDKYIPRPSNSDLLTAVHEYGCTYLHTNITVKDLFAHTVGAKMVPFEEASMAIWTWNRFACIGDAVHKMTPNLGQGANQAIESAATLTNCLRTMLDWSDGRPSLSEIQSALLSYERQRAERTRMISEMSRNLTNLEAKSTIWSQLKGAQALFIADFLAVRGANSYPAAPLLNFLPEPCRSQNATRGFDSSAGCGKDEIRCTRAFRALPLLCILCYAIWTCIIPCDDVQANLLPTVREDRNSSNTTSHISSLTDSSSSSSSSYALLDLFQDTFRYAEFAGIASPLLQSIRSVTQLADFAAIQVIWWVESFRRGNSSTVMNYAPLLFSILSQQYSISVVLPIYLFCHYVQSPLDNYAAQDLRLLNVARITTLLPSLTIGYLLSGALFLLLLPEFSLKWSVWWYLPFFVSALSTVLSSCITDTTPRDRIDNPTADLPYLRFTYHTTVITCGLLYLSHWLSLSYSFNPSYSHILSTTLASTTQQSIVHLRPREQQLVTIAILIWVLLQARDLKTKQLLRKGWMEISAMMLGATLLAGPGVTMVWFWSKREELLVHRRQILARKK